MRFVFRALIVLAFFSAPAFAQTQAPASPPAAAQNTVTTTGPVTSTTTIETGTLAGQALLWVYSTFGVVVGSALTRLILKLATKFGIQGAQIASDRLDDLVVRALHFGADYAAAYMKGKGEIEVKNAIVAKAVEYSQEHGASLIQALGDDPQSAKAIEGIKARIETAIADPTVPTPAVLAPTPAPALQAG